MAPFAFYRSWVENHLCGLCREWRIWPDLGLCPGWTSTCWETHVCVSGVFSLDRIFMISLTSYLYSFKPFEIVLFLITIASVFAWGLLTHRQVLTEPRPEPFVAFKPCSRTFYLHFFIMLFLTIQLHPHFIPDVILRLMLLIRRFVYIINVNMAGHHKSWNAYFSKRRVFCIFKCGSI